MWVVFELCSSTTMNTISVGFKTKEEAIDFRATMLEGANYKNSELRVSFIRELEKCYSEIKDKEAVIANAIEGVEEDSFYMHGNSWVVSKDDVVAYLT